MITNGCWLWAGITNGKGYGKLRVDGNYYPAHRVVYEALVDVVPEGLELDHLCSTPTCINPKHLEPVPHAVNTARYFEREYSNFCRNGHPRVRTVMTVEKRAGQPDRAMKHCLDCHAISNRKVRAKRRLQALQQTNEKGEG